ncbi:MAG: TlpA family protein disulfide reductase [Bacteroidota bacterium]|nr:TlpA family protein disulfide reductase [Bacteroidota bacterium]
MLKKTGIALVFLLAMVAASVKAQQKVFYRAGNGTIIPAATLDSIIAAKDKKLKPLGFSISRTITDKKISGDSLIYSFTLNAANGSAAANAKRYLAFIGKPLPPFSTKDLTGVTISTDKLKGKPLVINMWFTTCAPCIGEMPQLNTIRHDPANANVQFIAMTFDSREKVSGFLRKIPFDFIHLPDQLAYCQQFTNDFPINIFVDKNGIISTIQDGMPMVYDEKLKVFTDKVDPSGFNEALGRIR